MLPFGLYCKEPPPNILPNRVIKLTFCPLFAGCPNSECKLAHPFSRNADEVKEHMKHDPDNKEPCKEWGFCKKQGCDKLHPCYNTAPSSD